MFNFLKDLQAAKDRDPASKNKFFIFFFSPGFKALYRHRFEHFFYKNGLKSLASFMSYRTRKKTGVDIHPASEIGNGVFIDHASSVVIGETAVIKDNVTIYQCVTLGGTGKDIGKRHPTIEEGVMIAAGAKVLGPITIGKFAKIGANSVVLKNVPPYSTVVGIPGRIVKSKGEKVDSLNQISLPDPILDEIKNLKNEIKKLKSEIKKK